MAWPARRNSSSVVGAKLTAASQNSSAYRAKSSARPAPARWSIATIDVRQALEASRPSSGMPTTRGASFAKPGPRTESQRRVIFIVFRASSAPFSMNHAARTRRIACLDAWDDTTIEVEHVRSAEIAEVEVGLTPTRAASTRHGSSTKARKLSVRVTSCSTNSVPRAIHRMTTSRSACRRTIFLGVSLTASSIMVR